MVPRMQETQPLNDVWRFCGMQKNDSEQFAALLLVTKVVQAGAIDAKTRRRIFDAVGFTFLNRLLISRTPDGCPDHIFQALGLTLLACFCTDPSLAAHTQVLNKIPTLNEVICRQHQDNLAMKPVIEDAYQCLFAIAETPAGQQHLLDHGSVSALCLTYQSQNHGHSRALQLLKILLNTMGFQCWKKSKSELMDVFCMLCREFCQSEDSKKFELCEILSFFLPSPPSLTSSPLGIECLKNTYTGLSSILKSKLTVSQRDPALKLSSCLLSDYGIDWILADSRRARSKFLSLLVNLACVEVRLYLEDTVLEEDERQAVIAACYGIIEFGMMTCINAETLLLTQEQKLQLIDIMTEAFGAVVYYLKQVDLERMHSPFIFASVRILSAWLAEETSSLKQEICDLLPFLVHYARSLFSGKVEINQLSCQIAKIRLSEDSSKSAWPRDVLRFLLPGLCHLTAEEKPREILIKEGFPSLLLLYFCSQWEAFNSNHQSLPNHTDVEMSIQTSCGIFLNLVVTEPDLVRQEDCFSSLLSLLMKSAPSLVVNTDHLVLAANFVTLGLMIYRILSNSSVLSTPVVSTFFKSAIHLLSNAHFIKANPEENTSNIAVTGQYFRCWDEISELWFLGMQAFASCLPLVPWLPQLVLESGWPRNILHLLDQASPTSVDMELVTAFQGLLLQLAKHSRQCEDLILSEGGEQKANLYGMAALEQHLQGK
ncbi:neurochondrin isoform X2 [Protopterus annectens]|nr:neurochondrin isoform X2 [Protopterus annectens]